MNDDERLQKAFDKLREDDAKRMPSFDRLRRRPARLRPRSAWAVVLPLASAAAAAAVFVVWCNVSPSSAPAPTAAAPRAAVAPAAAVGGETAVFPAPARAARAEDAPLDFLLDVPGLVPSLRGTPNFDTSLLRGSLR
jgi:hypothetical protein